MAQKVLQINQIFPGNAPSQYFGQDGQFLASVGVDPDFPIDSTGIKPSGFIIPIGYTKFSGSAIGADVIAIINTPKDTKTYVITSNGHLVSYDSALGTETDIGTVAGASARGGAYYNNYIYIIGTGTSHDDVSRYGPLSGSPTITNNWWKGVLGKPALSDTTYPTLRSALIPNHPTFVHGDGALYFGDFESKTSGTLPGQGLLHKIHTKKTTFEGDTDDTTVPSQYAALDLPFGFYPTAITNSSTNIMVVGILSTDNTIEQGKAAFVIWDPTDTVSFFLGPVPLPDTLATAALNVGGNIYIWGGTAQGGVRLMQYLGGQSTKDVLLQSDGLPPLSYAVESMGSRVAWGGFTTDPTDRGCVWSFGSKDSRLPPGLHNIVKISSSSSSSPYVTALKKVQQSSYKQQKLVVAWRLASGHGIDAYDAAATLNSNIRFMFNVGQRFSITRMRIPFAGSMAANTTIQPKVYFDDFSSTPSLTLNTINTTNYTGKRKAIFQGSQLEGYTGDNNFVLEFAFSGTNPLGLALPIVIDLDVKGDEPA